MDLSTASWLGTPAWFWLAFLALVAALTAFDLGVLNRREQAMGVARSLRLSAFYVAVALAFGGWVWASKGAADGLAWYTGYFVEKALSIDNVFVISLIFGFLAIPPRFQQRALVWGIVGAILLRGLMIGAGAALVAEAEWVLLLFAAFLILTGAKMLFAADKPHDLAQDPKVAWLARRLRVTPELHGERFFVRTGTAARWAATPLFLALVLVNLADLVFAVDSVPAIFAISTDPFIVYTSNIMAVLGLRALYFALAAAVDRFTLLKPALALILLFIGGKIVAAEALGIDKVPPLLSLGVTVAILAGGVLLSLRRERQETAAFRPLNGG
ncbi:TerC/Alx family metal homeostasis membrane protein [Sphingomonas ginkgonis]|uniref:TerC/Alx family metal homeostasis membrane protein n=1 Tax=Sphingomonas ginkgonis TaxID=2315330 RepID=A0A3R9WLS9_9SPHN|nr:TerC/Alx family metal homeostasis membrane protein [Sphingomonas ginkgonis]RST29436.1 TerC/Alx family metal homeostasis membrane protein [Sphingomonas ginkgonis]